MILWYSLSPDVRSEHLIMITMQMYFYRRKTQIKDFMWLREVTIYRLHIFYYCKFSLNWTAIGDTTIYKSCLFSEWTLMQSISICCSNCIIFLNIKIIINICIIIFFNMIFMIILLSASRFTIISKISLW